VSAETITSEQIFAANRATGRIALVVEASEGKTRRKRVHEAGSLRVRFPGSGVDELEAVLVNTGGGITGGDCFGLEFTVGTGARLVTTTAAAEKIYRSLGPDAAINIKLDVGSGASLAWLPQETILFNQACMARGIEIRLAESASLVFVESIVFGRSGMGEAVIDGRLIDRWRVWRDGRLIFAETMRLEGKIAATLAEPAVGAGAVAFANVLIAPGDEATVTALRALEPQFHGEIGLSAWNGLALARLCAKDSLMLRHDLVRLLTTLRGGMLPRLWFN
jgi:urease accessory protein